MHSVWKKLHLIKYNHNVGISRKCCNSASGHARTLQHYSRCGSHPANAGWCYVLFWPQSFPRGPEALCASICAQWIKAGWGAGGIKLRALILLCIVVRLGENTLGLFTAEEMMPPRINMAKSSYQLHNGHAASLGSEQHPPTKGRLLCVQPGLVFFFLPLLLYSLCGWMCVHFYIYVCVQVCVFRHLCAGVYRGSFNQKSCSEGRVVVAVVVVHWGPRLSFYPPQIKLHVSMPVTHLIWDACPLLAAPPPTNSTPLHTGVTPGIT